jgi:hypothetical protein
LSELQTELNDYRKTHSVEQTLQHAVRKEYLLHGSNKKLAKLKPMLQDQDFMRLFNE